MKLPKFSRRQITIGLVAALAVFGLLASRSHHDTSATGGGLDSAGDQACSDFADGYPHATTKTTRLALADKVTANSQRSDNRTIADKASKVGNSANSAAEWKTAAADLTKACKDAGWVAK